MVKKDIIVFGCGKTLEQYIEILSKNYNILFLCDNNSKLWGDISVKGNNFRVMNPIVISEYKNNDVYVISIYWNEIVKQLMDMGVERIVCPLSDRPLKTDYPYCKKLDDLINRDYKKWYGNRKDSKVTSYGHKVYQGWNDHFKMHWMISCLKDNGYLPKCENIKILDYGCGIGTLGLGMLLRGYDFWGVDVDKEKHDIIMEKIDEFDYPKSWKERFILYDGCKLPFEDYYFDIVTTYQVLEHVSNLDESVYEIMRVCSPGGFAYLHCPNYDRSYEEHYLIDLNKPLRDNKEELKKLVHSYGADEREADYINFINKQDVLESIKKVGDFCVVDLQFEDDLADVDFIVRRK